MTKLKHYTIAGYIWLGVEFNGRVIYLYVVGRQGDCIR